MKPLSSLPGFDPRQVPVVAVDSHLPALDQSRLTPETLRKAFSQALQSGENWQAEIQGEAPYLEYSEHQAAAVLIPLVMRDALQVLLTQRSALLNKHSGQIAFPGGRADEGDADAVATALREADEEVGLKSQYLEVLGALPPYVTGSGYRISPVVALVKPNLKLQLQHDEVAEAFEVPLSFLMNPAHHEHQRLQWQDGENTYTRQWIGIRYTDSDESSQERYIWGVTASILRNFYRFLWHFL